jgi:hypothetical protein
MPPFVRGLILIFVGLPAVVMWLGGVFVAGPALVMAITQPLDRDCLMGFGMAVAAAVVGFAMISSYGIFVHGNRHGMAPSRLPGLVAIGSAAQLLGSIGLCTLVAGSMELLKESGLRVVVTVFVISAAAFAGSFYLHRLGLQLRAKWKFEHRLQRDGREVVRRQAE